MTYLLSTVSHSTLFVWFEAFTADPATQDRHDKAQVEPSPAEHLRRHGDKDLLATMPWLVMFRWIIKYLLGRHATETTYAAAPVENHTEGLNRRKQRQHARFAKRNIPASRRYIPRILLPRGLTRAQWFAWDARLTRRNPVRALRIAFRAPRVTRENLLARFGFGGDFPPPAPATLGGLSHTQVPPD